MRSDFAGEAAEASSVSARRLVWVMSFWLGGASAHTPAEIGFDQRVGASMPLSVAFADGSRTRTLDSYLHRRPVLLMLVYYHCPNLCGTLLMSLTDAIVRSRLEVGRDFDLIVVSIDPREDAAQAAKAKHTIEHQAAGRDGIGGAHFLTGAQASIDRIAEAIGFRYYYDAAADQYAHPAGAVVLTPGGRISRYLYGAPFDVRDLQTAIGEAGKSRVGRAIDRLWLRCFHYDPATGRYSVAILDALRVGAVMALVGVLLGLWRLHRRGART